MKSCKQVRLTMNIRIECVLPLFLAQIQNAVDHHLVRVVVEQDVDCSHLLSCRVYDLLACILAPQIGLVCVCFPALVFYQLHCLVCVFLLLVGEVCEEDLSAFHGKEDGG